MQVHGSESGMPPQTDLVVITDTAAAARDVARAFRRQDDRLPVTQVLGYFAAVAAVHRGAKIIVCNVTNDGPYGDWRLADLRGQLTPGARVVVVAGRNRRDSLAAAVEADLAVAAVAELPPVGGLITGRRLAPVLQSTA